MPGLRYLVMYFALVSILAVAGKYELAPDLTFRILRRVDVDVGVSGQQGVNEVGPRVHSSRWIGVKVIWSTYTTCQDFATMRARDRSG